MNTKINMTEMPEKLWKGKEGEFMFLGADVSHSSKFEMKIETPSAASLVGTCDRIGHQYHGIYALQSASSDVVPHMGEMVATMVQQRAARIDECPITSFFIVTELQKAHMIRLSFKR